MLKRIRLEHIFDSYIVKKENKFVLHMRGKPFSVASFAQSGSWVCEAVRKDRSS
jgi:hypothetical protein